MLTLEELKSRIAYNPETGLFQRFLKDGKIKQTGPRLSYDGYMRIGVGQNEYLAHRLAWLFHYGEWPKSRIDHINEIRHDNRIVNLRDVSASVNAFNSSKTKGYTYSKPNRKWIAQITVDREHHYIGSFETEEEARMAYLFCRDFILQEAL